MAGTFSFDGKYDITHVDRGQCSQCPEGTYNTGEGNTACNFCKAGFTTAGAGATECIVNIITKSGGDDMRK